MTIWLLWCSDWIYLRVAGWYWFGSGLRWGVCDSWGWWYGRVGWRVWLDDGWFRTGGSCWWRSRCRRLGRADTGWCGRRAAGLLYHLEEGSLVDADVTDTEIVRLDTSDMEDAIDEVVGESLEAVE